MSDKMRPIPFGRLMDWILDEYAEEGSVFGIKRPYFAGKAQTPDFFGENLELALGPAAGPHTQLAQNLAAAYAVGARFFELKTVQVLDGDDLPVFKPCILAEDEGYNVEWSTELTVPQAMEEYIKGWFALKLISREFGFGGPKGFVFNMSVGYDLAGIKTPKIDSFIEGMKDAGKTQVWQTCKAWTLENIRRFKNVDKSYIEAISPEICRSITLSTLHGCPPDEIERIAAYLLQEKRLHVFVKCNPTLLGYETARERLEKSGYGYVAFDDRHFKGDLKFADAAPMISRLQALAGSLGLGLGVKLTNTFPAQITENELPGDEMYMSGPPLFPLAIEVANRLAKAFDGKLRVSYSGGADYGNIEKILDTGIWPVTLATTLLKPGGYQRLSQMAELIEGRENPKDIDLEKLAAISDSAASAIEATRPAGRQTGRKMKVPLPLLDCYAAPCREGCPIGQDIPAYLRLMAEGKPLEALRAITQRNPLPFIAGAICSHKCMDKCTRGFYEGCVDIRGAKLMAAKEAYDALLKEIKPVLVSGGRVAVIGGGPAGLAAAYFLARAGRPVTLFEKRASLGGTVRHVIPGFRVSDEAIDRDIALVRAAGVEIRLNSEIKDLSDLRGEGYGHIVAAVGALKPVPLILKQGEALNALEFLESFKREAEALRLGKSVAVVGGGNTAMDAARAALRVAGVERVAIVYRRTKRYMPADSEELALALEEGAEFRELLAPVALRGGFLMCEKMALGEPDSSGRRRPVPTGEEIKIPADTVISAIGDTVYDTLFKGDSGVHVAGDAARGPSAVAEAIADGLNVAEKISGKRFDAYAGWNINPDKASAELKKGVLCKNCPPEKEPGRCLECATVCRVCAEVCPNRANVCVVAEGREQIAHIDSMCNECGNCATFCPYSGKPYQDKLTLFASEEDFSASENTGFLPLAGGAARVRIDGRTADSLNGEGLPEGAWGLIGAVLAKGYLR
jgi:putative selenate reductase